MPLHTIWILSARRSFIVRKLAVGLDDVIDRLAADKGIVHPHAEILCSTPSHWRIVCKCYGYVFLPR
jgi:hypothetical protein